MIIVAVLAIYAGALMGAWWLINVAISIIVPGQNSPNGLRP
jgi:hypothetical protein